MSFTVLNTALHSALNENVPARMAAAIRGQEGTGPDASVRKVAALAGYVSYGLMWLTLVWGIVTTTGWAMKFIRRSTVYGGHMTLAITTLAFTLFHAATYIFQTQENFSVVDAFVPFAGEAEVAIGIIAFELALAVAVSVWFQRKLTYRRWHLVHFIAYPVFALSLIHVFTTSSEARGGGPITLILAASTLGLIVLSVLRAIPHLPIASKARISHVEPNMTEPATPHTSTPHTSTPLTSTPFAVNGPASFQVTVSVDNNHCHLYAICVQEAPEVFDLSIDGRLRYTAKPAAHLYETVWNAARLCPMQAIHIEPAVTVSVPVVLNSGTERPNSTGKQFRSPRTNGKAS